MVAANTQPTRGKGKAIQWLRDHANYPHEDWCLIWPFSTIRGYGNFGYLGESLYAHTYMCELAHGPAPSSTHQPAHSCGMGDQGCANPKHLSWKTPEENQRDKRLHGTAPSDGQPRFKLSLEEVAHIRALKGKKTHDELSRLFGVSRRNIGAILDGRSWGPQNKLDFWTPEEDDKLREAIAKGCNFTQMAAIVGRSVGATTGRVYRLGLKSGQPPTPKKIRA